MQDLKPIILYIAIITYILKIYQTALAIGMWQLNEWEVLLLQLFLRILTVKERHNPLDHFRFFDVEDSVRNQNFVQK